VAEAEREESAPAARDVAAALARAALPWLAPARDRLAAMHDQGRLPHGLLIFGQPGAGQAELGVWIAARLLCRAQAARPCGACADCRLFAAGNHPDFHNVDVAAGKKEISIEQMRALSESLSLRSYRGGAKAALVEPAEAMNIKSFNALLKTLEEPADDTYLLLATSRSDRMPRTIASRCMRLRVPIPPAAQATAWLEQAGPRARWDGLLRLAHGAPFLALDYAQAGLEDLDRQMEEAMASAATGGLDVTGLAKAWAGDSPSARLAWLESWLTQGLRAAGVSSDLVNNNRLPWLRPPGVETKIRAGYRLLDQLRDARRLVDGSLNTQLLLEGLLVSLAALLGSGRGRDRE
jgi:DNA polymerase-3 subunit delta'